ncbi:hypothetical protein E2C01_089983 [Portunus trituberculatus]|uniref:Uncharacterized protein n=1 Tax=Portunus trituberculatus TaxID=210409 RepID=A0A5B7JKQ3_PORTR|nr:hypothetical protein [Portunus trituberculatus]
MSRMNFTSELRIHVGDSKLSWGFTLGFTTHLNQDFYSSRILDQRAEGQ